MCIQRETGAHRAVKVIKRKIQNKEEFAGQTKEEQELNIKLHEESVEKELLNEIGMLCQLVGPDSIRIHRTTPALCTFMRLSLTRTTTT